MSARCLALLLFFARSALAQVTPPVLIPAPPILPSGVTMQPSTWTSTAGGARIAPAVVTMFGFPFVPSIRERARLAFLAEASARDPAGAAQLSQLFSSRGFYSTLSASFTALGLRTDNLADVFAAYWIAASHAVTGITAPAPRATIRAVREQVAAGLHASPLLANTSAGARQELAERLLLHLALISIASDLARSDPRQRDAVRTAVRERAMASGIDLDATLLTDGGFALRPGVGIDPRVAIGDTAPATRTPAVEHNAARRTVPAEDARLAQALAAVPASNRPVHLFARSSSSFVGYPGSVVYTTTFFLLFANGWATDCADWDPSVLSPTPASLGRARDDCSVYSWRKTAGGAQLQQSDRSWDDVDISDPTIRRFAPGERVDVSFGNLSGISAGTTASTMDASELRLTAAGSIAVGEWSSTVVAGPNFGGGSQRTSTPLRGRYRLDGYLIAVQQPGQEPTVGFAIGVGDARLDFIYLNGKRFSRPGN